MIDKHAPEIAKVDGQPSSPAIDGCPSPTSRDGLPDDRSTATQDDPESIGGTMSPSIPERSHEAGEASLEAAEDRLTDDDQRLLDAVAESLKGRSVEVRQALLTALLNGAVTSTGHVSGLELSPRKTAENKHSTGDRSADPSAPHVSGTTSSSLHLSGTNIPPRTSTAKQQKTARSPHFSAPPVSGTSSLRRARLAASAR